jgi:hypothetical protein
MTSAPEGLAPPDPALLDPFVHALRAAAAAHVGRATGRPSGGPGVSAAGALVAAPADLVDRAAEVVLRSCCDTAWRRGWLPAEVLHQGRRSSSVPVGRLVAAAVANDHVDRRSTTLHPAWVAHVEALELPPADGRPGWVTRWAAATGLPRSRSVALVVQAVAQLSFLPPLDPLLPPPGATSVPVPSWYLLGTDDAGAHPVLGRIRALLAKAESTTFEAEALAFTAKAHELMAKHAVDTALVVGRTGERAPREQAVAMRLCVDAPYVDIKSTLLHVVAKATRGRVVQHPSIALCTVVGHPADLEAIEVLYTSLLVQAQRSLDDARRRSGPAAGGRRFRSSFLAAYAHRIGQRLEEVDRAVVAEATATHGATLVPLLAARADAVDAFIDEHFADLRTLRSRRSYDPAGYASGRLAAERATLAHGEVT